MLERVLIRNPQQLKEIKTSCCRKGKAVDDVTIPESWDLNARQRDFIEMMIDKKTK